MVHTSKRADPLSYIYIQINGDTRAVRSGESGQGDKLIISYLGKTETVGTKITLPSEHPLYEKLKK